MGDKEEQVKALRLKRYARNHPKGGSLKLVSKPVTFPTVMMPCPQCQMYEAEIKALKMELAKRKPLEMTGAERSRVRVKRRKNRNDQK